MSGVVKKQYAGRKFGKLQIIREWREGNQTRCEAMCECGDVRSYFRGNVVHGLSTQCRKCAAIAVAAKRCKRGLKGRERAKWYRRWTRLQQVAKSIAPEWATFDEFVRHRPKWPRHHRILAAHAGRPLGPDNHRFQRGSGKIRLIGGQALSLADCARMLGVSRQRTHRLYLSGKLDERMEAVLKEQA